MGAPETLAGEIDGVQFFHMDRPGLTTATLHIGVGWADETFATRGVTHVVEHVIMHGTTRGTFDTNGTVVMHRTAFWATGKSDQVGRFLNEVAAAIRELPLEGLAHEAKVLKAEVGQTGYGPHEAMLKSRYGNAGPGLGMFWGLGSLATDADRVAEHAKRWFVRSNAVLTVLGPMPEGLRLALPEGPIPLRTFTDISQPGVVSFDVNDPVLSVVLPDGLEVGALAGAMAQRLEEELRHGNGQVYGIGTEVMRLPGTGKAVVQLAAKTTPDGVKDVAEAMARELVYRAAEGVTSQERAEMLEWWDLADEGGDEISDLETCADRFLCGLPARSPAEARAQAEAMDLGATAELMRTASSSALLLVPRGVETDTHLPDGKSCSSSRVMTTTPLRRRLRSKSPKKAALGFSGDVVEYRDEDGDVHSIEVDEIVGVGVDGNARELIGRRGCFITVDPRDFAGAEAVIRAVEERVPAGIQFSLPEWFGTA